MFKALRDHSQAQRLDGGDCLLPVLTISHHAGQRWDLASQRPSSSRSISTVNVTVAIYHPQQLSNKRSTGSTAQSTASRFPRATRLQDAEEKPPRTHGDDETTVNTAVVSPRRPGSRLQAPGSASSSDHLLQACTSYPGKSGTSGTRLTELLSTPRTTQSAGNTLCAPPALGRADEVDVVWLLMMISSPSDRPLPGAGALWASSSPWTAGWGS